MQQSWNPEKCTVNPVTEVRGKTPGRYCIQSVELGYSLIGWLEYFCSQICLDYTAAIFLPHVHEAQNEVMIIPQYAGSYDVIMLIHNDKGHSHVGNVTCMWKLQLWGLCLRLRQRIRAYILAYTSPSQSH